MGFQLQNLLTENQRHPLGIDCENPRFSWQLVSEKSNLFQTDYQIQVKDSSGNIVADTGKVRDDNNVLLEIPGLKLYPRTKYEVNVNAWNNYGEEASIKGTFETGKMGEKWVASWIEPDQIPTADSSEGKEMNRQTLFNNPYKNGERDFTEFQPVKYIRIPFSICKDIKQARVYVTAHGFYRLYVNGQRADESEFCPDLTTYHKVLMYQTYDVTPYIKNGENVFGVELADGWWSGRTGMSGDSCQFGNTTGLLLEGRLTFNDGTVKVITGENGKSSTGPLIFSDIFVGEKYDAQKEISGWNEPEFDDRNWKSVHTVSYDCANITGQYGETVKPYKILEPEKIIHSPAGEQIVDVGQVVAGNVEISLECKAGHKIKLEHSEVLDEQGNFYNNIIGVNKEQQDIYITKEGKQTYRPHFTYHGFRYIKITGWPGEIKKDNFRIFVFTSEMKDIGQLRTSDKRINRLIDNIRWSQIGNTISIPTDCPQRERAGWGGDIMVFAPTMCKNRNADAFLTRWMMSVRADQFENGAVPNVVPYLKSYRRMAQATTGFDTCCGWGDTVIQIPLTLYREYGDKRILTDNYPAMKKWIHYIQNRAENYHPDDYETWDEAKKSRSKYLWNTDFHYGDWLIPSMVLGNPDGTAMIGTARATMKYVAPAYYANSALSMSNVADILGKADDKAYYLSLYKKIREAFIEEYVNSDGSLNTPQFQGLYVITLKNHLCPEELRPKMASRLNKLIRDNNDCLDTGFLSVHYLLDVLCENGYRETAYKILFQTKCPSWLYEVEHGATTIWESWGAIGEDGTVSTYSYNHYAFGCVGDWLYREIGGIQNEDNGYRNVVIRPAFDCGLREVECVQDTPNGILKTYWILDGEKGELTVVVPCNTRAKIILPDNKSIETGSGTYYYQFLQK